MGRHLLSCRCQSQVGYNKDGVYLTFIHNCPSNQETATGAMIYALPKWAVYKGATYFWSPVWTAWDIYDAVGQKNNDDYYPGAFIQMQPVIPQRAADVQADVTYFVSDVSGFLCRHTHMHFVWQHVSPALNAQTRLHACARALQTAAFHDASFSWPQGTPGNRARNHPQPSLPLPHSYTLHPYNTLRCVCAE